MHVEVLEASYHHLILIRILSDRFSQYLIIQIRKLRHREVKCLAQGHRGGKGQGWDLNPGRRTPVHMFLPAGLLLPLERPAVG